MWRATALGPEEGLDKAVFSLSINQESGLLVMAVDGRGVVQIKGEDMTSFYIGELAC
jgi:hypothetical protein